MVAAEEPALPCPGADGPRLRSRPAVAAAFLRTQQAAGGPGPHSQTLAARACSGVGVGGAGRSITVAPPSTVCPCPPAEKPGPFWWQSLGSDTFFPRAASVASYSCGWASLCADLEVSLAQSLPSAVGELCQGLGSGGPAAVQPGPRVGAMLVSVATGEAGLARL